MNDADPPAPASSAVDPDTARRHWRSTLRLTMVLLVAWFGVGFAVPWFARDLEFAFFGWPFSFWVAAQGGTCVFVALIVVYAARMRQLDRRLARATASAAADEASHGAAADAGTR